MDSRLAPAPNKFSAALVARKRSAGRHGRPRSGWAVINPADHSATRC